MTELKKTIELSISPGVLVYYTNHVTLRKIWIVNKQRKKSGFDIYIYTKHGPMTFVSSI